MSGFIPLGIVGGEVRFPLVGAGILVTCVGLFATTWLWEPNPSGLDVATTGAALEYWEQHPYLEVSDDFRLRVPAAGLRGRGRGPEAAAERQGLPTRLVEREQETLDGLVEAALGAARETLFRRLALSTVKGLNQPGWVTHLFLHAGWMHLLGNMLFLYAVALLLEDAWGRWRFLAFYLAGGVVSGAAQYLLDRGSGMLLVGASGAVSACIGAAMVRFATRHIRVGYLFFVRVGTFTLPVWLWGLLQFLKEGFDLATGASPGVAVLAHVVGMLFGAVVALGMRAVGLDRTLVGTDEADVGRIAMATVEEGEMPQERGHQVGVANRDPKLERATFEAARAEDPNDPEALWGLCRLDLQEKRKPQALAHLERLASHLLKTGQRDEAQRFLRQAKDLVHPREVRPELALLFARILGGELSRPAATRWWRRAAQVRGPGAPYAIVQAASLVLDIRDVEDATELLGRLDASNTPDELKEAVATARDRLRALRSAAAPVAPTPEAPARGPVLSTRRQLVQGTVLSARAEGVSLQLLSGPPQLLRLEQVKAVAAGYVPNRQLQRKALVLVVLDWGAADRPGVVLQLDEESGGVERLRPDAESAEAYFQFALWLAEKSGTPALPSPERLRRAEGPFCADVTALCAAVFTA